MRKNWRAFLVILHVLFGGVFWIAVDLVFGMPGLSDASYWVWVCLGAYLSARGFRLAGVLACAALATASFLMVPTMLVWLGLPADFVGLQGALALSWVGVPAIFGIHLIFAFGVGSRSVS